MHRGDVHDLAAALLDHDPAGELAELEGRREVHLDHLVPVGEVVVDRLGGATDPVRVDEDVEAAQPLDRLVEAAAQGVAVGEVGTHGDAAQLRGCLVGALRAAENGHARACVDERARNPAPDPAAAARDERAAAGQIEGTGHCSRAPELGEDSRGLAVGLLDELDHPVGLRHPLELDRHRPVKPVSRIACRYSLIGVTPRPGGRSPCTLPSQSDTCTWPIIPVSTATSSNDAPERCRCETSAFAFTAGWSTSRIRSRELVDAVRDRVLERLQLDHQLDSLRLGVLGELRTFSATSPNLLCRDHLQVAVVLADDEQHVAAAEVGLLVDVRLAAVEREPPHRRDEVDEAERDADGGADRQPDLVARLLDQPALRRRSIVSGSSKTS